jgi:hypothetical protein
MMIQVKEVARIENPRQYEPRAVEHLLHLLKVGIAAERDPQRENFYEIDNNGESYYIHISPVTGDVMLLAKWLHQSQDCCLGSGRLVA